MIKKIESYFLSSYELVDSRTYYLKLSILMGLILTGFVFLFDPYDTYLSPSKYEVPLSLIQLGYGINLTFTIYLLSWFIFYKMGYKSENQLWKTYHHWLLILLIFIVAGFSGTVYHRTFIDVGNVETSYYALVTTPRTILIGSVLFTISILLDKLYEKNKRIKRLQKAAINVLPAPNIKEISCKGKIDIKSPIIKQSISIDPKNITYLKAFGNYVEIHLKNKERASLIRSPLHFVAQQLTSYQFIKKCHRQYYVNIYEIEFYKGNSERISLNMKNSDNTVPVSKKYTKNIISTVENFQYQ